MPIISYEGIQIDIPSNLNGLEFTYADGQLTFDCQNFTGKLVLNACKDNSVSVISKDQPSLFQSTIKKDEKNISDCDEDEDDVNFLNVVNQSNVINPTMYDSQLSSFDDTSQSLPLAQSTEQVNAVEMITEDIESSPSLENKTDCKGTRSHSQLKRNCRNESTSIQSKRTRSTIKQSIQTMNPSSYNRDTYTSLQEISTACIRKITVATTGTSPAPRWGHTVTRISNNQVIVYGGENDDGQTLGDLHVLDFSTKKWSRPINCESIPRAWHDAVYVQSKKLLLVFGGERLVSPSPVAHNSKKSKSKQGKPCLESLSDIMVLDSEYFLWYPPAMGGEKFAPPKLSGHTCTNIDEDVVIFGGCRGRDHVNTLYFLNVETWQWIHYEVVGSSPQDRTYHSAVAIPRQRIVYFGGNNAVNCFNDVHILEKQSQNLWIWHKPIIVGRAPEARTGQSMTLLEDNVTILITGGWDPILTSDYSRKKTQIAKKDVVFNDAWLLNTKLWKWEAVNLETTDSEAMGYVGHGAVLLSESNKSVVTQFGGQNQYDARMNDLYTLSWNSLRNAV